MTFSIHDFIHATQAQLLSGSPHGSFDSVSIDTRTLQKGDLFFALAGPHHDGHDHLLVAARKGAAGVVIQSLDDRLRFDREQVPEVMRVDNTVEALQQWARHLRQQSRAVFVGLTGSNGKTTTKEMIFSILSRAGKTLATRGNLNNHLGLPLTLCRIHPDDRYAVLEMGTSREGEIALLANIARPFIGLITNIGKAHLQGLKSPEGVLQEKRAVLDALPVDGVAVINQDDPLLAGIAPSLSCRRLFFGMTTLADVRAENIVQEDLTTRFTLIVKGERATATLSVPGQFQVMNALAASAVAFAAGVSLKDIVSGLAAFKSVAMRMQVIPHASGALLINDAYNANPSSIRMSVQGICQAYPQRSRWLVLGDMRELGGAARAEHRDLGKWLASQPLERIFLYGRDTRFVLEALQGTVGAVPRAQRFRKKKLLMQELQQSLSAKPVILFKGSRAMKLEQIIQPLLTPMQVSASAH